jgi:hypothetical protein
MSTATVWRVDLDTEYSTITMSRKQHRASSAADAERMYADFLASPPTERFNGEPFITVSLVFDCRLIRKQMLHGAQEVIS